MSDITLLDPQSGSQSQVPGDRAECQECVGSGGWYRYEPAAEAGPGQLYLSCVGCQGSGRMAFPRD